MWHKSSLVEPRDKTVSMGKPISYDELYAYRLGWNEAIDAIIENAPTVDAETVIRCKDCESWGLNAIKKDEKGEVIYGDCLHFCCSTPKWFYCAWGERKNGQ
jgi:hypothetical protein